MAKEKHQQEITNELMEWYQAFVKQVGALREKDNGSLIGRYFIIRDGEVLDYHDNFEMAYKVCIERYKDERFLIQELLPKEYTNFVFSAS